MLKFYYWFNKKMDAEKNKETDKENKRIKLSEKEVKLIKIYNMTKARNDKQKNHQEICVIFSILKNWLQANIKDAVQTSKEFLREQSIKYKNNKDENLENLKIKFEKFNDFLIKLSEEIEYPFSISTIEDKEKYNKYSVGISMVIAAIFHYLEIDIDNETLVDDIQTILSYSPMGEDKYKGSSTTMKNIIAYLFDKHKIQYSYFESVKIKPEKIEEIKSSIQKIKRNTDGQLELFSF